MTEPLTVAELMQHNVLRGARLAAGESGLGRPIRRLNVMTVPDIGQWVGADEFLLTTGFPLPQASEDLTDLLRELHNHGLAGLGVKLDSYLSTLPDEVVAAANELGFPIAIIPLETRFDDILSDGFTTIINRQAAELARANKIHHTFLAVTLAGGGLANLAAELGTLLEGASVLITDQDGHVLASSGPHEPVSDVGLVRADSTLDSSKLDVGLHRKHGTSATWAVAAIRAGSLRHGFVVAVEGPAPLGDAAMTAIEQAAIVAALEVTRDLAVAAVERQFASNALHHLISSPRAELEEAAARATGFGWELGRQITVLVSRVADESLGATSSRQAQMAVQRAIDFWCSTIRARDKGAAVAAVGTEFVAVVATPPDVTTFTHSIQAELTSFTRHTFAIGISRSYPGPSGIPAAYGEARSALRLGHRVSGAGAVTAFENLGLFRLLAQLTETELLAFVEDTLGPVMSLPEPEREDLLQTLEALIRHNRNIAEAARHVHYHYNTLRYRLSKLERLLGPFSTDANVAIRVGVALQILQMRLSPPGWPRHRSP
jgi:purine catabolism regulator